MKVIMMMAITADGMIGKHADHLANWTSKEDKQEFIKLSKECGVIMMGSSTFNTFPAPLKDRLNVVFTREENLAEKEGVKYVSGEPQKILKELEEMGYTQAMLGGGAQINSLFLKEKLIDEIVLTIEPKIFGAGIPLFKDENDIDLELLEMKKLNENTISVRYKVKY